MFSLGSDPSETHNTRHEIKFINFIVEGRQPHTWLQTVPGQNAVHGLDPAYRHITHPTQTQDKEASYYSHRQAPPGGGVHPICIEAD